MKNTSIPHYVQNAAKRDKRKEHGNIRMKMEENGKAEEGALGSPF